MYGIKVLSKTLCTQTPIPSTNSLPADSLEIVEKSRKSGSISHYKQGLELRHHGNSKKHQETQTPSVAVEGARLLQDVINHNLTKEGFKVEFSKQSKDKLSATVIRLTDRIIEDYHDALEETVNRLSLKEAEDTTALAAVANEVLENDDKGITWSRILTLYAFFARLAVYCHRNNVSGVLRTFPQFAEEYIELKASRWISEHGGWEAICSIYNDKDASHTDQGVKKMLMITGTVLSLTAAAFFAGRS